MAVVSRDRIDCLFKIFHASLQFPFIFVRFVWSFRAKSLFFSIMCDNNNSLNETLTFKPRKNCLILHSCPFSMFLFGFLASFHFWLPTVCQRWTWLIYVQKKCKIDIDMSIFKEKCIIFNFKSIKLHCCKLFTFKMKKSPKKPQKSMIGLAWAGPLLNVVF